MYRAIINSEQERRLIHWHFRCCYINLVSVLSRIALNLAFYDRNFNKAWKVRSTALKRGFTKANIYPLKTELHPCSSQSLIAPSLESDSLFSSHPPPPHPILIDGISKAKERKYGKGEGKDWMRQRSAKVGHPQLLMLVPLSFAMGCCYLKP